MDELQCLHMSVVLCVYCILISIYFVYIIINKPPILEGFPPFEKKASPHTKLIKNCNITTQHKLTGSTLPTNCIMLDQLTAGVFGMIIAYFDKPSFDFITSNHTLLLIIIGLCVSGGSGAWNTILNILKELSQPKTTKD